MVINLRVEFWLWMGRELGENFHSPSDMRSTLEIKMEDGTRIRELFTQLSESSRPIGEKIFNSEKKDFYPYLVVTLNDRVLSPLEAPDRILREGDKVTVLPMYMGG